MDLTTYLKTENEKPLDRIATDGGFTSIFRTIGCVGDSLSSGEFESTDETGTKKGYHDYFAYSWGQYIARRAGCTVYNFSRGGMTAKEYMETFSEQQEFWNPEKVCQAYILALGVNDLIFCDQPLGSTDDICKTDYTQNKDTFCGWFARIIQRLKGLQPKAKFFFLTMPQEHDGQDELRAAHAELMRDLAKFFDNSYVIDLYQYGPVYDEAFKNVFYLGGHMNASGYKLTGDMVMSYIDYIIRSEPDSFRQVGFIGRPVHNYTAKW